MTLQTQIIKELHVAPKIEPADEVKKSVELIKRYLLSQKQYRSLVLAVSGGQDSTLVGKLARIAVDELNQAQADVQYQLIAIRQPYGKQADEADAQAALAYMQPDLEVTTNIQSATDAMVAELRQSGLGVDDLSRGSIKPKMRMIAQYAVAREHQGVVLGTDHAAESVTGFFTKYGDGGTDLNPIWRLDKRQGTALLAYLQAPEALYRKVPTADLEDDHPQLPDEKALGVTYNQIDDYLEGQQIDPMAQQIIEDLYLKSQHKRHLPATIIDDWF